MPGNGPEDAPKSESPRTLPKKIKNIVFRHTKETNGPPSYEPLSACSSEQCGTNPSRVHLSIRLQSRASLEQWQRIENSDWWFSVLLSKTEEKNNSTVGNLSSRCWMKELRRSLVGTFGFRWQLAKYQLERSLDPPQNRSPGSNSA